MKPDRYTVRESILTTVNTRQGVNGRDLVLNCMGMLNPQSFDDEDYASELTQLVVEREIEPLYFFMPYMGNFYMQTIYFPKGTRLVTSNDQAVYGSNTQGACIRPTDSSAIRMGMGSIPTGWKSVCTRFIHRFWRRITLRRIHPHSY